MRMSCSCHESAGGEAQQPDRPKASFANVLYSLLGIASWMDRVRVWTMSTAPSMQACLLHVACSCISTGCGGLGFWIRPCLCNMLIHGIWEAMLCLNALGACAHANSKRGARAELPLKEHK